jgi:hypothetical protein
VTPTQLNSLYKTGNLSQVLKFVLESGDLLGLRSLFDVARWKVGDTLILFLFEGLLYHSAQQEEGKCGRGFSQLGGYASEARLGSLVLQKIEGSSVSSSDEKGATS